MRALLVAAVVTAPLVALSSAHAQVQLADPARATSTHSPSFEMPAARDYSSSSPIHDGMIAQEDLAPNANLGVGLAPMHGRNRHSLGIDQQLAPTSNPGVRLVIKFPH